MAGVRFEDVDLLGALSRIVDLHTQHYKEDFDLDKELISKLAVSERSEDKQLLWMSRPCGTYTLREREVYLEGSHENKVWRFYQEQTNDPVLAYAIRSASGGCMAGRDHWRGKQCLKAGHINCVIVKDLSRLGRNSIDTGYYIEQYFHAHNVRFIAVTDQFDTADSGNLHGGIMLPLKNMINEAYALDIGRKIKAQARQAMKDGDYIGARAPYGYRKSADGRMEPDEDVAPNVQMIFQWASEGNTAAEITRKLYAMNIPTPGEYRKLKGKAYYNVSRTNGVWSTSTVLRILEDQRYIGTYVIGKRKVKEIGSRHTQLKDESEWFKIPNHHPAIVSVDLFERANASIKRFSLSNKKPRDYLLRGKVFCGCCDHAMSLRNGAWFYCRHSEVAETLPCHGVRIKMADLEQVVFETIRAQMCPALGIDSNKDKLDLQTVQQTEHEEKLRSIQDSKRYLYEQYALGEIDLETYRTRKAVYDTELVQAKNVHAVITAQTKQIKSDYEIKLKQQEIVQKVGNANMLTKALIDRLINKVYVFPGDRIEIEYATQDFLETKESEKEV